MAALRDILGSSAPQSVRKLARQFGLNKYTVWHWRMLVFTIIGSVGAARFSGIVAADETYYRESRKGSRAWVQHFADGQNDPQPPRPRWEDFTTKGLKMMRCLSKWQIPILTVADRGGARLFQRRPNRKSATLERTMKHLVPNDAVHCSDGANGYTKLAATGSSNTSSLAARPARALQQADIKSRT